MQRQLQRAEEAHTFMSSHVDAMTRCAAASDGGGTMKVSAQEVVGDTIGAGPGPELRIAWLGLAVVAIVIKTGERLPIICSRTDWASSQ